MSEQNKPKGTVNLGLVQAIHTGVNPPVNKKLIWFDEIAKIHKVFNFKTLFWIPLGNKSAVPEDPNDESLTQEFVVSKPAGNYEIGQIFPAGMNLAQAFESLLTGVSNPIIIEPSYSLSFAPNIGVKEVGEVVSFNLISIFNAGSIKGVMMDDVWNLNAIQNPRAGAVIKHVINGQEYITTDNEKSTNTITHTVALGNNSFSSSVHYNAGPIPKDSANENYGTALPAGVISKTSAIEGALRTYVGGVSDIPYDGDEIRSKLLSSSKLDAPNNFTFQTGTTDRIFIIAIPSNKTLIRAKNTGTNEDLKFTLSSSINIIKDAGGAAQNYKVYIMINALSFSKNYTINIEIA